MIPTYYTTIYSNKAVSENGQGQKPDHKTGSLLKNRYVFKFLQRLYNYNNGDVMS